MTCESPVRCPAHSTTVSSLHYLHCFNNCWFYDKTFKKASHDAIVKNHVYLIQWEISMSYQIKQCEPASKCCRRRTQHNRRPDHNRNTSCQASAAPRLVLATLLSPTSHPKPNNSNGLVNPFIPTFFLTVVTMSLR